MIPIKSFDGRNVRVNIVRDECPEHPFNSTDAPIRVYNEGGNRFCFWHGKERQGLPYRGNMNAVLYFDADIEKVDSRDNAEGAIELDCLSWQVYCGFPTIDDARKSARVSLRAYLAELQAWSNGDVYGFTSYRTFVKNGHTYEEEEVIDSCFGFYGKGGIRTIADYMPTEALKRAVRSWARRY